MIRKTGLALSITLMCFIGAAQGSPKTTNTKTKSSVLVKESALLVRLTKARAARIAALKEYIKTGKFPWGLKGQMPLGKDDPHFDAKHERTHRFRGKDGRLCALAYLIWQSGDKDLVTSIEKKDNHFCLGKDKNAAVEAWIRRSGLTKEECIAIQRPGFTRRPNRPKKPGGLLVTEAFQKAQLRKLLTKVVAGLEKNSEASLNIAEKRVFTEAKVG
ncbi:MAG: hypothetical protein P1V97_23855 [Planctomycetota bacterium]|nr:hypothetical protein [Planctomycetota bacterium]